MRARASALAAGALAAAALLACGGGGEDEVIASPTAVTPAPPVTRVAPPPAASPPATSPAPAAVIPHPGPAAAGPAPRPPTPPPESTTVNRAVPTTVVVPYRIEVRTPDPAAASFPAVVESTLSDPRGWRRAGFLLERREDAPYLIVIAEGPDVDALCLPHDTYGEYSCQRETVVAINAERWREATPKWTGDLPTYRQMVVNHEVGHLLGQPHPRPQCPAPGRPAPVMAQQSTELDGCLPNPWPLPDEIERAARHDRPLAPL